MNQEKILKNFQKIVKNRNRKILDGIDLFKLDFLTTTLQICGKEFLGGKCLKNANSR
jgi:hypothetical protein